MSKNSSKPAIPIKGDLSSENALFKEIDLLQSCISRMAENSFKIKGWYFAILAAIIALWPKQDSSFFASPFLYWLTITVFSLVFWFTDASYLAIERAYREKYNKTLKKRLANNFDGLFDLSPNPKFRCKFLEIIAAMASRTLLPIYLLIPIFMLVLLFVNSMIHCGQAA